MSQATAATTEEQQQNFCCAVVEATDMSDAAKIAWLHTCTDDYLDKLAFATHRVHKAQETVASLSANNIKLVQENDAQQRRIAILEGVATAARTLRAVQKGDLAHSRTCEDNRCDVCSDYDEQTIAAEEAIDELLKP